MLTLHFSKFDTNPLFLKILWDIFFLKNLHFTENAGVVLGHFWKNGQNVLGNPLYIY